MSACRHGWLYCPECFDLDPHPYSEHSARAKLARLRGRGIDASMREHAGKWFITTPKVIDQ